MVGQFHAVVLGYPHNWSYYTCTVRVRLDIAGGGAVAADSVNVGSGVADTLSFTLPHGRYDARFTTTWRGRPGADWDLEGGPVVESVPATVPGTYQIQCP